jgi:stage II sporulation protein D
VSSDNTERIPWWSKWLGDPVALVAWALAAVMFVGALWVAAWPRGPVRGETLVRVRVIEAATEMNIASEGSMRVRASGRTGRGVVVHGPVRVAGGAEMVLTDARGRRVRSSEPLELLVSHGARLSSEGSDLGDRVVLVPRLGESVDVVRVVELERYVAGVLGGELLGHWPQACFEAQAICARSYVIHEMSRAHERHFDVGADHRTQVFAGAAPTDKAVAATARTRGVVLRSEGKVLRAYFSSVCGGRSASAGMVWPARGALSFNAAAGLAGGARGHACAEAPLYRWSRTRERREISLRVRSWAETANHPARTMGLLARLEVAEVSASGRPGTYEVLDSRGQRSRFLADDLRVAMNDVRARPMSERDRVMSNDFEVIVTGDRVEVRGRGFGHGVGLCQYCAAGWAREGYSAPEMLGAFYPGATLGLIWNLDR